jgi:phage terminase large subunit-like protein
MDLQPSTETSSAAIAAVAVAQLYPEPEWIARAADEFGYQWARIAWQRAATVPGAWFDVAKAQAVVECWPKWFTLTVGRFAGKPFRLSFWQEVVVRLLVGWKRPIDVIDEVTGAPKQLYVRLFQELRLWIPRKNGKSEFLAALGLLFWFWEGSRRGQGFCFAHDENQAREVFDKMGDMIVYSTTMSAGILQRAKNFWIQEMKSPFRLMPGKAKGKHGRAPTVTVGDEMHEWVSRELADTLRQGEGASLEPIRLYASTAGLKSQKTGYSLWDESQKVLDGRVDDPTMLVVIFAVEEEADWRDERNWALGNPSLGLSPTLQFLRGEAARAESSLAAEAAFRRYHLNQWVEEYKRWIPLRRWDASVDDKEGWRRLPDELRGRKCHLAFDSTWTHDFAAMCLRFEPIEPDEKVKFLWTFWLPGETIERRAREEQVPFDKLAKDGAIIEVPGGVFQNAFAIKATIEAFQRYDVQMIGWDSWSAKEYYNACVAEGISEDKFLEMRMGARSLGEATRQFEKDVGGKRCEHGGHPVARWMMGHCNVRFDENMNYVPAKKRSDDSIDGIITAVMTQALSMTPAGPDISGWLREAVMTK